MVNMMVLHLMQKFPSVIMAKLELAFVFHPYINCMVRHTKQEQEFFQILGVRILLVLIIILEAIRMDICTATR
jgi:hypothetical protein